MCTSLSALRPLASRLLPGVFLHLTRATPTSATSRARETVQELEADTKIYVQQTFAVSETWEPRDDVESHGAVTTRTQATAITSTSSEENLVRAKEAGTRVVDR